MVSAPGVSTLQLDRDFYTMNSHFSRIAAASLLALAAVGAHATVFGDTINNDQTYNQPQSHATGNGYGGQGGAGGAGGQGGAAAAQAGAVAGAAAGAAVIGSGNSSATGGNATGGSVLGSGNSNVRNDVSNAQQQGQAQGQQQGQQQGISGSGNSTAAGGAGGSSSAAGGQGSGNTTKVEIGGDTYERSAPSVFVSGGTPLPTGCRYVFGIGGSNANGSVSTAGLPLWKDSECKGGAAITAMGKAPSGTYKAIDFVTVSCDNFDAMENTPTCRKLRSEQAMEAEARRSAATQYAN